MQEQPSPITKHQLTFTGSGAEYFKIWIVNILLTICTLYIFSAWAKVRSKRYFYGNTILDGSAFEYHAKGKQLVLGRLIGLALVLLVTLGDTISWQLAVGGYLLLVILTPWAICRSSAFNAQMSSYRNVRFGFTGTVGKYYKYLLLVPAIPLLVAGLIAVPLYLTDMANPALLAILGVASIFFVYVMFPWVHGKLAAYAINQSQYGTANFKTEITTGRFYSIYIKGLILSLVTWALMYGLMIAAIFGIGVSGALNVEDLQQSDPIAIAIGVVVAFSILAPLSTFVRAYVQCRLRNYQYDNTLLDERFQLSSSVTTFSLWWLELSNLLIILLSVGLAYPWAAVRKARFMANNTHVASNQSADHFVHQQGQNISSMGEEIGDAFDMDIAAGF